MSRVRSSAITLAAGFILLAAAMWWMRPEPPVMPRAAGGSLFLIVGVNAWWWPAGMAALLIGIAMWAPRMRSRSRSMAALVGLVMMLCAGGFLWGFGGGRRTEVVPREPFQLGSSTGAGSFINIGHGTWMQGLPPRIPGAAPVWWDGYSVIEQARFDWMYAAGMLLGSMALVVGGIVCWKLEVMYVPPHLCENCRYDLRGCRGGKCPECGLLNAGDGASGTSE